MAEFEDKLQAILGDPEAMGQIASLAQALSGGQGGEAAPADGAAAEQPESGVPPSGEAAPDLSALLGALSGGDSPRPGCGCTPSTPPATTGRPPCSPPSGPSSSRSGTPGWIRQSGSPGWPG